MLPHMYFLQVWDERNAFKKDKRTGVHLTIDLCSLMQAWVPMRDSWWLLENVDDGEIHIQVGLAACPAAYDIGLCMYALVQ